MSVITGTAAVTSAPTTILSRQRTGGAAQQMFPCCTTVTFHINLSSVILFVFGRRCCVPDPSVRTTEMVMRPPVRFRTHRRLYTTAKHYRYEVVCISFLGTRYCYVRRSPVILGFSHCIVDYEEGSTDDLRTRSAKIRKFLKSC